MSLPHLFFLKRLSSSEAHAWKMLPIIATLWAPNFMQIKLKNLWWMIQKHYCCHCFVSCYPCCCCLNEEAVTECGLMSFSEKIVSVGALLWWNKSLVILKTWRLGVCPGWSASGKPSFRLSFCFTCWELWELRSTQVRAFLLEKNFQWRTSQSTGCWFYNVLLYGFVWT